MAGLRRGTISYSPCRCGQRSRDIHHTHVSSASVGNSLPYRWCWIGSSFKLISFRFPKFEGLHDIFRITHPPAFGKSKLEIMGIPDYDLSTLQYPHPNLHFLPLAPPNFISHLSSVL